jgi:hypothetical protein
VRVQILGQEISDPSRYKCHPCYCSPEVSKAMPVGWEHMDFSRRKVSKPPHSDVGSAPSPPSSEAESDTQEGKQQTGDEKKSS